MEVRLSQNIRAFRKEKKLTQEQLAEALGVTVGAVSKWESGASVPDIRLIMELAGFFDTSVDVLLGYEWRSGHMSEMLGRIRSLRNEKRFEEAGAEAEKALQKYPNAFDVVFQSAILFSLIGTERGLKEMYRRALTLFERSIELLPQNTNAQVNEWTIRNDIAGLRICLGDVEEALEILKKNNAAGLNNASIGYTLAYTMNRSEEALPYLSDALIHAVTELYTIVRGYMNAYEQGKHYDRLFCILDWLLELVRGAEGEKPCYLNKIEVQLMTIKAIMKAKVGDAAGAESALSQAQRLALAFDAAPSYDFTGMRYFHSHDVAFGFDDFGETAIEGIEQLIASGDNSTELIKTLWHKCTAKGRNY